MKAELLDDKLTQLTPAEVCRAFMRAFFGVTTSMPSSETLALLMAQSALESGRWKSLHCFNFTNIKASDTYVGFACFYRCNEIINGKVEWFDPPHPQCRFRAFKSIDGGALDYLTFLSTRKRYATAWARALQGDPVAFVSALKSAGFFTANEEPYRKAVVSLTREYMRQLPNWLDAGTPDDPPIPSTIDSDENNDLRATAIAAATESRFALLDDLRRSTLREMSGHEDPNDTQEPDGGLMTPDSDEVTVDETVKGNA